MKPTALLLLLMTIGCASQPVPVACPKLPDPPARLMEPPRQLHLVPPDVLKAMAAPTPS